MHQTIQDLFDLTGRLAVVSGGSRGLGKQIGAALGGAGARVLIVGRDADAAADAARDISAGGVDARSARLDVTDRAAVEALADRIAREDGGADILINAAGVQHRSPALEFSEDKWRFVVDVNLTGVFWMCQAFGRQMVDKGAGKIVNIGSLTSQIGLPGRAAYTASKGAVLLLTRTLAMEWAASGVNVNAIGPGYFRTEMNTALFDNPEWVEKIMVHIPMKRAGTPQDLEGTAVYLCSAASDYMTGQIVYVDGGFLAGVDV